MTTPDAKKLARTAQRLLVEFRRGYGSPPAFETDWHSLYEAKVDRIEISGGTQPSQATIWFPTLHWHQSFDLLWGDMIRIRTDQTLVTQSTIVFEGYVSSYLSDFSGGSEKKGSAYERSAVLCLDARWLLSVTCPVFGCFVRGPDDYTDYGTDSQTPIADSYIFASGSRCIFNKDGRPNRDSTDLVLETCSVPIFADPSVASYWTARQMLCYILSHLYNRSYNYFPIADPSLLVGLGHEDFDKVIGNVSCEGLNMIDAAEFICRSIGWSFRTEHYNSGSSALVFYKIATAAGYVRDSESTPIILHRLHAPAVAEDITTAVAAGKKILWAMNLAQDMASVVNNPWGLGSRHQFEITAELVPAWLDSDFTPDTSDSNAYLFLTDSELQDETAPDSYTYFKYYHPAGSLFRRSVGRKWALNEAASYTPTATYDRGAPFAFENHIDPAYLLDPTSGKRLYAPFARKLLAALTLDDAEQNSVGIKVEFSFDSGTTWQVISGAISNLEKECGIYIDEPNLAEMSDKYEGTIAAGDLAGMPLNYFTSLADDKVNDRSFKAGSWQTRVRVTASIELDQRIRKSSQPSAVSGSPFFQTQLFDFSEKYGLKKRTATSTFASGDLAAWQVDSSEWFSRHMDAVRRTNEDMSISGQFTLERLWLGDGAGVPDFYIGDGIEGITGRNFDLSASIADRTVFPEIVKIIYLPGRQKMQLITRDLRFAARGLY